MIDKETLASEVMYSTDAELMYWTAVCPPQNGLNVHSLTIRCTDEGCWHMYVFGHNTWGKRKELR